MSNNSYNSSNSNQDFKDMDISLIGSMKEGTRIFAAEELDIHLSLNQKQFEDRTKFDEENQTLYVDDNIFDGKKFHEKFLKSVFW